MASFCSNCGYPLGENVAFCSRCGARHAAAAPTPAPKPKGPKTNGGSALKIVLIVVAVLMVFGIAAVGSIVYMGYRVKQAVVSEAHRRGLDLTTVSSSKPVPESARRKPCDLLSPGEVSSILGERVARTEPQDNACVFYAAPGRTSAMARENIRAIPKTPHSGQPDDISRLMRSLAGSTLGAGQGEPPLLLLTLSYDAAAQWTALAAGSAIFSGIPGAGGTAVEGVGDKAIRMVPLGLTVLKGSTVIGVVPGPIANADERTISVAKLALSRL